MSTKRSIKTSVLATDALQGFDIGTEQFQLKLTKLRDMLNQFGGQFIDFIEYVSEVLGWNNETGTGTFSPSIKDDRVDKIVTEISGIKDYISALDISINNINSYIGKEDDEVLGKMTIL